MAIVNVTQQSFESTISLPGIVFLDCWANWCPPCRAFRPVYEKASDANPDILFGSIDTEAEVALAGMLGISSIPTIMAFRDGILVFAQPGALRAPDFDRLINAVRALDMDEVRAKIAEQEAAEAAEMSA